MTALAVLGKHSFYRHSIFCGGVVEGAKGKLECGTSGGAGAAARGVGAGASVDDCARPEVVDEVLTAAQAVE
jgi:hypothetical protein